MARDFRWHASSGAFDGAGNWQEFTSGAAVATQDVPGSLDLAVIDIAAVTVAGPGSAAQLDLGGTAAITGTLQFGTINLGFSTVTALFSIGGTATLTVGPGATLDASTILATDPLLTIGANGTALLKLTGAGAALNNGGNNALTQIGIGSTLDVLAGATANSDVAAIFGATHTGGALTVDGSGSTLDTTWLLVGYGGGAAEAFVQNGGVVSAGKVNIGDAATANGLGTAGISLSGAATLIDTGTMDLGDGTSDSGSLTLAGTATTLRSAGITVGNSGAGSVTIESGATLDTAPLTGDPTTLAAGVADAAGAQGNVVVTGAGSQWSLSGRLNLGGVAAATIKVLNGAALRATMAPVPIVSSGATFGLFPSFSFNNGMALVSGAGSTLDANGGPAWIGVAGTATLSLADGARASVGSSIVGVSAMALGVNAGTGVLTLSDPGTRLTVAGQLDVGGTSEVPGGDNAGTLNVLAGATLVTGHVSADPGAGFVVAGVAGSSGVVEISGVGSVIDNSGRVDIGRYGAGTLEIQAGGTLETSAVASEAKILAAGIVVGTNPGSSSEVVVQGAGSLLSGAQGMSVGLEATGTLAVLAGASSAIGGTLSIGSAIEVSVTGEGNGFLGVSGAGSALTVGGDLDIGEIATGYNGVGTLSVLDGGMVDAAGFANIAAGSQIVVDNTSELEVGGSGHAVAGAAVIDSAGLLLGAGTVRADLIDDGSVEADGGALVLEGALSGPGRVGLTTDATLELSSLFSGRIIFDGRGTLKLDQSIGFLGTIDVTNSGGTIDLADVSGGAHIIGNQIVADGGVVTLNLAGATAAAGITTKGDGGTGTDVIIPCFARGTRLRLLRGDIAVEDVRVGDVAATASGGTRRVVWVGSRTLDCRRHPHPQDIMPIRVAAGAFAPGRPSRDLLLSPDHALLCEDVLIPIRYLLNGRTVAQENAARITYFHVELETHDVLLAENLPAESFLDTGNRTAFAGGGAVALHPDFARAVWQARGCAKLLLGGAPVERARKKLLRRAAALGHGVTADAALRVVANGHVLPARIAPPEIGVGVRWRVALPPGTQDIRLQSRTWVPSHTRPAETDTRCLGVPIRRLWLEGRAAALDSPALRDGWHPPEPDLRWTTGDALLPVGGVRELIFDVAMDGSYWVEAASVRLRRRIKSGA